MDVKDFKVIASMDSVAVMGLSPIPIGHSMSFFISQTLLVRLRERERERERERWDRQ